MNWRAILALVVLFGQATEGMGAQGRAGGQLAWSKLSSPRGAAQVKLEAAGAFVGMHNGALIVAGGAEADGAAPSDRVAVLLQDDDGNWRWRSGSALRLPASLAFGTAVSTPDGVICAGGTDGEKPSSAVLRLRWDPQAGKLHIEPMPSLPFALSHAGGAMVGKTVYLAGGRGPKDEGRWFLALDFSEPKARWREMEPWHGPGRLLPLTAGQNDGAHNCFYLFGGRSAAGDLLADAYKYDPKTSSWKKLAGAVTGDGQALRITSIDAVVPYGDSHLFVFDSGRGGDSAGRVWAYHTITDTWVGLGEMPAGLGRVDAVRKEDRILLVGRPAGLSGPVAYAVDVRRKARPFGALNIAALVLYLLTLVGMGFFFSRREKSTGDFFIAGRRVPWWAAGLSIFGTQLSSISFMAIPAKVYMTDWLYYATVFCIVAVQPIVVWFYLPFFRRLNVTTAYEYLEKRFNVAARLFGSLSFILFQCGRMTIVLFLPALALSAVTGINIYACILIMGVLATLYTVLGGIEAVIWTDVVQVCVLLGAGLLSLGIIVTRCGGFGEVFEIGRAANKFRMVNLGWDWTLPVLWVLVVGNLFSNMMSYSADQAVIQRYLTTRNEKTAAGAIWTNAAVTIPIATIWFLLGTALFAFYKMHPASLDPTLKNDQIFPLFIAQQLPDGVVGVVIAGLFAAAMSTVDSSLNSISTAITTDFYRRFRPDVADHRCLNLARILTLLFGVVATGMGLWMAANQEAIKSLWDMYMKILGLVMGGLTGLFALGIFTRRAHGIGALIGVAASTVLLWTVQTYTPIHFFLYAAIGIGSCFIVGYLASLMLPVGRKSVEGLTVYTIRKKGEAAL